MTDHTNDNDIDALLRDVGCSASCGYRPWRHAALTALVAERNALRKENNELRSRCKIKQDEVLDRVFEMDALRKRVAELEAQQPADRDLSAKIDKLSSSVSILTCRVAALESAKFVGPHVPVNPWNPYPTTPWIIYGTRTSDRIEESA